MPQPLLVDEPAPQVRQLTLNRPAVPEAIDAFLQKRPADFVD
ncbi:MAG TPA: hypothetical protein VGI27_02200 [Solirubrobacteraceae bacterium]|jgi:hypothetical protein